MHGHAKKCLDDYIPFQLMAYFLLQICTKGDFLIKLSPFDYEWPWITCHNKNT